MGRSHDALAGAHWDGANLVIDNPEALKAIRRKEISPSVASSVRECEASFAAGSVLPRGTDPFQPFVIGTAIHDVLEHFYNLAPEDRTAEFLVARSVELADREWSLDRLSEPDFRSYIGIELDEQQSADQILNRKQQWLAQISSGANGVFGLENPRDIDVHSTEMAVGGWDFENKRPNELKVSLPGLQGDFPVQGKIDRVRWLHDDNGRRNGDLVVDDWKGFALDTPVPTPGGWTTISELKVGDYVFGNGAPVRVTAKSPVHDRPCYRITFADGESVVSDNVHEWFVDIPKRGISGFERRIVSTDDLAALVSEGAGREKKRFVYVPSPEAVALPAVDLPLDPYIFGAWLGDGESGAGRIAAGSQDAEHFRREYERLWPGEVVEYVNPHGHSVFSFRSPRPAVCPGGHDPAGFVYGEVRDGWWSCPACRGAKGKHFLRVKPTHRTLKSALKDTGALGDKRIPAIYLRGSIEQRMRLLQGLMDTDGYWNQARHRCVFITTSPKLADGARELLLSLGVVPKVNAIRRDDCTSGVAYYVEFSAKRLNPFSLARRAEPAEAWRKSAQGKFDPSCRRRIVSVEHVESVPTQCITVESEDSLFLVGKAWQLTHNCGKFKKPYGSNDTYGDQQRIYTMVFERVTGIRPTAATLLYPVDGKQRPIDVSEPALHATLRKFEQGWLSMNRAADTHVFTTKPSNLCGWCPLANVCPVAKVITEKAATEAATKPSGKSLGITVLSETNRTSAWAQQSDYVRLPRALKSLAVESKRESAEPVTESEPAQPERAFGADPATEAWLVTDLNESDIEGDSAPEPEPFWVKANAELRGATRSPEPVHREEQKGSITMTNQNVQYPASEFAAMNAFSVTDLAVDQLESQGVSVTPTSIQAFAAVLGGVVEATSQELFGRFDWAHGSTSRLVYAVRESVKMRPAPFSVGGVGGTEADWTAWQARVVGLSAAKARVALGLVAGELDAVAGVAAFAGPAAQPVAAVAAA